MAQIGVSSEGTELITTVFPAACDSEKGVMSPRSAVNSGALLPTRGASPSKVSGVPLNVTYPCLSCMIFTPLNRRATLALS